MAWVGLFGRKRVGVITLISEDKEENGAQFWKRGGFFIAQLACRSANIRGMHSQLKRSQAHGLFFQLFSVRAAILLGFSAVASLLAGCADNEQSSGQSSDEAVVEERSQPWGFQSFGQRESSLWDQIEDAAEGDERRLVSLVRDALNRLDAQVTLLSEEMEIEMELEDAGLIATFKQKREELRDLFSSADSDEAEDPVLNVEAVEEAWGELEKAYDEIVLQISRI